MGVLTIALTLALNLTLALGQACDPVVLKSRKRRMIMKASDIG